MRHLYSLILYLLTPFLLLRLWWKGRRLPAYRARISERFGSVGPIPGPIDIWVHAVSLGEVVAATPLVEALLADHWRLLSTTMTPTGSACVSARFGARVFHQYLPFDLPWCMRRFFQMIKPRLVLILETELWPNLMNQAQGAGVPVVLVNARLSDKSWRSYQKVRVLFKPVLNQFTSILAQSREDGRRFIGLGAEERIVEVIGNIKFDATLLVGSREKHADLKKLWGSDRVVVIAASTHADEEALILACLGRLQQGIGDVLLLIAPRHPQRFQEVYDLSLALGFKTCRLSAPEGLSSETEVVVLDCLGELQALYFVADYAFVGGSLVSIGGHNVLEPIAAGVAVFTGPHVFNFKAICQSLAKAEAIVMVDSAGSLVDALVRVHHNQAEREQLLANARVVLDENKGAVGRVVEVAEKILRS